MADTKRVVHIQFKAYFDDTGKMFDTNIKECAEQNGLYDEKGVYVPMPYIVGSGKFYAPVDEAIATAEIGKEIEISVPCENGAGPRNPKLVEVHPIKEFYKNKINPCPGLVVSFQNRSGVIVSVGAGRVKVDFNNMMAGHDITYKITVTDEVTDAVEKAKAIMEMNLGTSDGFGFSILEDKVVITEADFVKFNQNWVMIKYGLVGAYRDVFGLSRIEFCQIWDVPKQ